jgi:hypothetical protein
VSGKCLTIFGECLGCLENVLGDWDLSWSVGGPRECMGSD